MNEELMKQQTDEDVEIDDDFSFDGYQVVRGEFFSHIFEPSLTFNNYKVQVNTACIKKLPEFDYVQIMVNPDEKKLAVRPCMEDEKDSFRWCSATAKRSPKQISCRMFFAKVFTLMNWQIDYKYKLLGKLKKANGQYLFVFDLNAPEIYKRTIKDDGKSTTSRSPVFLEEWKNDFGIPVSEHKSAMQIGIFNGQAVFGLKKDAVKSKTSNPPESEETRNEQTTIHSY